MRPYSVSLFVNSYASGVIRCRVSSEQVSEEFYLLFNLIGEYLINSELLDLFYTVEEYSFLFVSFSFLSSLLSFILSYIIYFRFICTSSHLIPIHFSAVCICIDLITSGRLLFNWTDLCAIFYYLLFPVKRLQIETSQP